MSVIDDDSALLKNDSHFLILFLVKWLRVHFLYNSWNDSQLLITMRRQIKQDDNNNNDDNNDDELAPARWGPGKVQKSLSRQGHLVETYITLSF